MFDPQWLRIMSTCATIESETKLISSQNTCWAGSNHMATFCVFSRQFIFFCRWGAILQVRSCGSPIQRPEPFGFPTIYCRSEPKTLSFVLIRHIYAIFGSTTCLGAVTSMSLFWDTYESAAFTLSFQREVNLWNFVMNNGGLIYLTRLRLPGCSPQRLNLILGCHPGKQHSVHDSLPCCW